jgi:hypothetical protein
MGSHRRFVSSGPAESDYLHPLESYGGWFDFTTNLREEQKAGGTLKGWLDSLVGGFEEEDIKASPTVGGINIHTGKPFEPSAANTVANVMDESKPCAAYPTWMPDWLKQDVLGCEKPKPDLRKLAVVASVVVASGVVLYATPKIIARYKK